MYIWNLIENGDTNTLFTQPQQNRQKIILSVVTVNFVATGTDARTFSS